MISNFNSSQEEFWAGKFGAEYIYRNNDETLLDSNIALFSDIFSNVENIPLTFLELGANIGMNIKAIQKLIPKAEFTGIEINHEACLLLAQTGCEVVETSIMNASIVKKFDFVFSKTVLIHLPPEQLIPTYRKMYEYTNRFILIAEYYNPTPVEVTYRGNADKLFKRDFAGEFLDLFPDVTLKNYGFVYHRDPKPQDDINWFLLEKS